MNKVILVGNLTRDPEYRTTPNGASVCNFSIAVQRRFANQQGVREADFINCVAWRQQADFVHRFFTKGRRIGIVGSLQTRTYDAQDGSKRYVTEVVCDECEFVDSRPQGDGNQSYGGQQGGYGNQNYGGQSQQSYGSQNYGYNAPAQRNNAPANDFAGQGFTQVDDDDQLPF